MNCVHSTKRAIKHSFNWFCKRQAETLRANSLVQLRLMNNWNENKSETGTYSCGILFFSKRKRATTTLCDPKMFYWHRSCVGTIAFEHESSMCFVAMALLLRKFSVCKPKRIMNRRKNNNDGSERITHKDVHFNEIKSTSICFMGRGTATAGNNIVGGMKGFESACI